MSVFAFCILRRLTLILYRLSSFCFIQDTNTIISPTASMADIYHFIAAQAQTMDRSIYPAAAPGPETQVPTTTSEDRSNTTILVPPQSPLRLPSADIVHVQPRNEAPSRPTSPPPAYHEAISCPSTTPRPPSTPPTVQPVELEPESQSPPSAHPSLYTRLSSTHKRFKHSVAIVSAIITLAIFTLELWSHISELAES